MAVVKAVHSNASIAVAVNYVTKNEKSMEKLISGKDCNYYSAIDEMKATKKLWGKSDGRQYDHYVQSFAGGEQVTPEAAHEIANRWAKEQFPGHECLIATHIDKDHIHSHIIVNSVNFEDGSKLHRSAKWLDRAKHHSDELCREYGLSITQKGKTFKGMAREDMTSFDKDKYQLLLKAEKGGIKSYVLETSLAVMESKQVATSRDDFIKRMAEKGYQTNWQENHKNITFTDGEGNKVRAVNVEKTFKIDVSKDTLEKEFQYNRGSDMKLDEVRERRQQQGPELPVESRELPKGSRSIMSGPVRNPDRNDELATRNWQRGDGLSRIEPVQAHEEAFTIEPRKMREQQEPLPVRFDERTAEETAQSLMKHKAVYMDLEKQIQKQNEINAQEQREYNRLTSTTERLAEKEHTIKTLDTEIGKLQEQQQGLRMFQNRERKNIDEQIARLEHSRQQAATNLEREYGVKTEQIPQAIGRLTEQAQQLRDQQHSADVVHLKELQEKAEIEYKAEKLIAENHPDRQKIDELLKQEQRTDGMNMQDRLNTAAAESRLNNIGKADLEKIRVAKPGQNDLSEIIKQQQQQTEISHSKGQER